MKLDVKIKIFADSFAWILVNYLFGLLLIVSLLFLSKTHFIMLTPSIISFLITIFVSVLYTYYTFLENKTDKGAISKFVIFLTFFLTVVYVIVMSILLANNNVLEFLKSNSYIIWIMFIANFILCYALSYQGIKENAEKVRSRETFESSKGYDKKADEWEKELENQMEN